MKYLSCIHIEHGITFFSNSVQICCISSHVGGGNIMQIPNYKGELIDWDKIFEQRAIMKNHLKNEIVPKYCEGCYYLKKQNWSEEKVIKEVLIGHWTYCNCNCSYCYTDKSKQYFNNLKTYNVFPVIKDMMDKNILSHDATITFGGGEPTILEEFDDLIHLLLKYGVYNIRIHSSGIKYSKSLEKGLSLGKVALITSVDSGSKEIYEKIKHVNAFDKVWSNLKEYAKHNKGGLIRTKYVLIPGINDSYREIVNWLILTKKAGITDVSFDIEDNWYKANRENVPDSVYDMMNYVSEHIHDFNINSCELYERASNYKNTKLNG